MQRYVHTSTVFQQVWTSSMFLALCFNRCGFSKCMHFLSFLPLLSRSPSLPPSLPFPPQATITISSTLSSDTEESQSRLTLIFVILAVIIGPIIIITIITIILWRVSSIPIYLVRYYIYTCTHSLSTAKRTKIQI